MDIDKIEDEFSKGNFSTSMQKVLEELMYMTIQNNSLLRVLVENQAKVNNILDPLKSKDDHLKILLDHFKEADTEKFASIMSRISDK